MPRVVFDTSPLGMIAGAGDIPLLIARQARCDDRPLPTIALSPQIAADLAPYCPILCQHGPGQLSKIIRTLQHCNVRQVVMVGKVEKRFFFQTPRLDLRALRRLGQLPDYRDVTLMDAVADEFAREGLQVVEQTRLLGHLLTPEGVFGRHRPDSRAWEDIGYGFAQAKQLASMDIGQTVVVRRRTILAVEALEGTDATIRRGCAYGRGAVVVKVNRRQQDMRFDVPVVGPHTPGGGGRRPGRRVGSGGGNDRYAAPPGIDCDGQRQALGVGRAHAQRCCDNAAGERYGQSRAGCTASHHRG